MKKFKELMEKAGDTAVFTFGRFNPPTTGHEKLIDACAKQQSKNTGSKMYVYASQSNDPKKNPLPYAKKIAYMRKMFKKYSKNITTGKPRTAIEVAVELHEKGHTSIVMVVGSDRVAEFDRILNEYNGVKGKRHGYYGFDNIEVVSAGARDPDAEGVTGMSASKMRQAAADGDFQSFEMGVPSSFAQRKELYRDVRKGMGMREEREMGDMNDIEYLRDLYLTGKIWNAGDIIEAKGITGSIVRKGTNYVSFADDDGKVHKCWIHEIELNEASALDRLMKFDKSRVAAGKSPIFTDKKGQTFVRMKKSGMMSIMNVPADEIGKFEKKGYKIIENVELDERNYAKEYANYQGTPEQIARRSSRNKARRVMGDKTKIGMDVGHADNDPMNNDPANLRNEDPSKNRREPRLRDESMSDILPWLKKLTTVSHPRGMEKLIKSYAKRAMEPKYKDKPNMAAADVARQTTEISPREFVRYINKLVDKGVLPKELKAEYQTEHMSFKDFVSVLQEVKQDSDIKDKDGAQPAKYHKGLSKSTKDKRDAHFKKNKTGPAPGDADAETKPSVHTKKFKKMFGEDMKNFKEVYLKENKGLKNKSEKSGISVGILKKVYDRGLAAYKGGHRPGTTAPQWAMARVNSFITKGSGTWGGADKDLAKQAGGKSEEIEEDFFDPITEACWTGYKQVGMKKKGGKEVPNCVPEGVDLGEESELNEWGEIEEVSEYQGRKVTLNKPSSGDVKKSKVYVKNEKGNVVKVNFGDPNMTIKKSDPARRKSFRARHNCENPGPKWMARYWSCKAW